MRKPASEAASTMAIAATWSVPWLAAITPSMAAVERPTIDASPSMPSIRFRALMQPTSQRTVSGMPSQPNSIGQPKATMRST